MDCGLMGHRWPLRQVWNNGLYFGECPRCGNSVIRSAQGSWRDLPANTRIAWKSRGSHCMDWWEAVPESSRWRLPWLLRRQPRLPRLPTTE